MVKPKLLAANARPDLAAGVSIIAGTVTSAEVTDLQNANKVAKTAKANAAIPVISNPNLVDAIRFISLPGYLGPIVLTAHHKEGNLTSWPTRGSWKANSHGLQ